MIKTIGILGAGQLAKMLALAAHEMGVRTVCYDANDAQAAKIVTDVVRGSFEDKNALLTWAKQCDVITYETENIPLSVTDTLASAGIEVVPSRRALAMTQNRILEKTFCRQLGISTADFVVVRNEQELRQGLEKLSYPAILKTACEGYDGKGQYRFMSAADLVLCAEIDWQQDYILEKWVSYQAECSLLSVRAHNGSIQYYPLSYNRHEHGMLVQSHVALGLDELHPQACSIAERILQHFDYVGVFTIEFFVVGTELWINEMAPRVHNSYHWTIEGAVTSQFANHVRALLQLPLGKGAAIAPSYLFNCIGQMPDCKQILSYEGAYYHHYGKTARAGRKLGHVTWCDFNNQTDPTTVAALTAEIHNIYQ